jgi:hypothetical protein
MHHRAEYLLQVLEKIGSPLLVSIVAVNARAPSTQLANEAQKIAELLAKTVKTGIDMSYALDLGPTGQMTDSVRVALTGLAGPLVAESFKNNGKTPTDAEIKRLVAALQAVLSFAENFEANSENSGRLKNISADGSSVDKAQGYVQYIQAFIPVIGAVNTFSFGQAEQKLILDISSRLTARAEQIRANVFGDLGADNKRVELGVLKALTEIYAACHEAETQAIQNLTDEQRGPAGLSTDKLWKNFDMRTAMLEALARGMAGEQSEGSAAGGGSRAPKPKAEEEFITPPPQTDSNPLSMFAKKPEAQAGANDAGNAPPPQQGATNPMSFFKGPPKGGM